MKLVYFGSSQFARAVLEQMFTAGVIPSLIVTRPDKQKDRGLKFLPTEISSFAEKKGIPCVKPLAIKGKIIEKQLQEEAADLFVVVDYGRILPEKILALPSKFSLALHPSLLPSYRGPAPIQWALINGETETGITVFKMSTEVDSGEIISQAKMPIEDSDDIFSLTAKLKDQGSRELINSLQKISKGTYTLVPQDDRRVSFAPKLKKEDGKISWEWNAVRIGNFIRGTLGWPSAYIFYKGKAVKILAAEIIAATTEEPPATIIKIEKEGIYVAAGKGIIKLKKVKPANKKEMDAWSFVCGYRVKEKDSFSS